VLEIHVRRSEFVNGSALYGQTLVWEPIFYGYPNERIASQL
jgi:hypothetical protein